MFQRILHSVDPPWPCRQQDIPKFRYFYQTIRCHITEDSNLYSLRPENFKNWPLKDVCPLVKTPKECYTGCGRKNTPIWEGRSFRWGARLRTAVYVLFSVYTMAWLGEHRAFIVEEFIKMAGRR